jgi:hypothetical protein
MLQGTALRALFSVLAGVLFALQPLTPSASAATGHKAHVASTEAEVASSANCGDAHPVETDTRPAYARDRQRAEEFSTESPSQGAQTRDPAASALSASHVPAGPSHRLPRPATDRSPAVLQVFRC